MPPDYERTPNTCIRDRYCSVRLALEPRGHYIMRVGGGGGGDGSECRSRQATCVLVAITAWGGELGGWGGGGVCWQWM